MKRDLIYYSCVLDATPVFFYQTWGLVQSLLKHGDALVSDIFVHHTPEVDPSYLRELAVLGVHLVPITRFGDGKYCNKIVQTRSIKLDIADAVVFMDTDMIVLAPIRDAFVPQHISGRIVGGPNPSIETLTEIFAMAGFADLPTVCEIEIMPGTTFQSYLNGGLYVVPGFLLRALNKGWEKWALWLRENIGVLVAVGKEIHVDQISFLLAVHELAIPVHNLALTYNYPAQLGHSMFKSGSPRVLHYHRNLNANGTIDTDASRSDAAYLGAVALANVGLSDCSNSLAFRSFASSFKQK